MGLILLPCDGRKGVHMNKDMLVLKDGTEIELEAGASLGRMQVAAVGRAAMLETWNKLTEENLERVQVKTGEGLTVGNYQDLILVSERSVVAADGSVLTEYQLCEKTAEEKRLDALEEGQAVQDGAIEDLGAVSSALAAQMEGGMQ